MARIEALAAQVAELSRRLRQNSGNSSLPPSPDRFAKPKRERRQGSVRKPGKQPGTPGSTLELVADPDEVIEYVPASCAGCGAGLEDAQRAGMIVRQVRDVPAPLRAAAVLRAHVRPGRRRILERLESAFVRGCQSSFANELANKPLTSD